MTKKAARKKLRKPSRKKSARKARELLPEAPAAALRVAKKVEKAAKKRPRKIPGTYLVRANEIRRSAEVDYITDPEARSAEYWYGRKDRPYSRTIVFKTFLAWCQGDEWVQRREDFWAQVTQRIIQERQKQVMLAGLQELEELTEVRTYMGEYLQPKRDARGVVERYPIDHKLAGLPVMPLALPSIEKFVKMFLELEKHLMLKRGEAITRSDSIDDEVKVKIHAIDPIAQKTSINRHDVRAMAQLLLERRQPELVMDAETVEEDSKDDDEDL